MDASLNILHELATKLERRRVVYLPKYKYAQVGIEWSTSHMYNRLTKNLFYLLLPVAEWKPFKQKRDTKQDSTQFIHSLLQSFNGRYTNETYFLVSGTVFYPNLSRISRKLACNWHKRDVFTSVLLEIGHLRPKNA